MSDEINTTSESTAVDTAVAPASTEAAAPVETSTQAAPVSTQNAAPDYGALNERLGQYEQYFQRQAQMQEANDKRYREMQEVMLRTFAPDEYRQRQQPRYVTEDQFSQMQEKFRQEAQASAMAMAVRTEIAAAKEKFSDVFEAYEEEDILRRWQKTGEPISSICKKLEERTAKEFEKRQAKFMANKQQVAETTKGSPKSGGAPAPSNKNGRGLSGLRQAIRDRLVSS